MNEYKVIRSNATPVVSTDFITIIGAEDRSWGIVEIDASGANSSAVYTELGIYDCATAGVTPSGGITPVPDDPDGIAARLLVYTGWGTQPVLGSLIDTIPLNGVGKYFWRPRDLTKSRLWKKGGNDNTSTTCIRPITINGNTTLKLRVIEI